MSHVQSISKASAPLATDTLQLTGVGAGHTLICALRLSNGSDLLTSLTDSITSDGSPVRIYDQLSPTAGIRTYLYKKENVAAGTHTFTANWTSAQTWRWILAEYSEGAIDVTDVAPFASGTAITGPSVTPTVPNGTLVGLCAADSNATSFAPRNGETERQEINAVLQLEDLSLSTISAVAPEWMLGSARAGVAMALVMMGHADPSQGGRSSNRGIGRGMFRGF